MTPRRRRSEPSARLNMPLIELPILVRAYQRFQRHSCVPQTNWRLGSSTAHCGNS